MCYKNINYEFRNRQIHELEINNNKNKEYVSMNQQIGVTKVLAFKYVRNLDKVKIFCMK